VIRWAAVGTGTISHSVVPDLQTVDGNEVVLVHSRDAAKAAAFAEQYGIPRSTGDYEAAISDPEVDAVYLATPFATHHELARRALLAGKHVLVEKPMAMTAAEVEDLLRVARERGVFLMEAMWMKFNPAYRRLHEEIAAGTIGEVRSVRATFSIPFPDDGGGRWDLARSGGAFLDQGIYPITLAHDVLGEPEEVTARGLVRDDGLDLSTHFTLDYADGRFAQGAASMVEFGELTASVAGTRGWITLAPPFWARTILTIHAGDFRRIFAEPEQVEYPREGNGYVPMLREVAQAIGDGVLEHPVHPEAATVAAFRTIDDILARVRA